MTLLLRTQKKWFIFVNIIFATVAFMIEQAGISLKMYFYADTPFRFFDVPLIVIICWIVIGHTSWAVYRKFGWIAGLLTGILIDLPLEILAFHLGWWTWIPSWTPAIFFNAPALNFSVYLSVSLGSILIYKYVTKSTGEKARAKQPLNILGNHLSLTHSRVSCLSRKLVVVEEEEKKN